MSADDNEFFEEKTAARLLKIGARTLRRYRVDGKIGYHRLPGGRVRYSLVQLLEFRAACRIEPTPQLDNTGPLAAHGHLWPLNDHRPVGSPGGL